jgi:UDP-N-acetylmuramoylalanine--D-glutamate ligase
VDEMIAGGEQPWVRGRAVPARALVVGAGRSGTAAAKALVALGASVVLTDRKDEAALGAEVAGLKKLGVELALGSPQGDGLLEGVDLVVVSPGVPSDLPLLEAARRRSGPEHSAQIVAGTVAAGRALEVVGELEWASRFIDAPCVAISGTNGKSTTTLLVGQMAAAAGRRAFVGGNLGTPLSAALFPPLPWELVVLEVSSFQLELIHSFHPAYAALLNVTPDHLDRYPDYDHYIAAKRRLFLNVGSGDVAVLNAADPLVRTIGEGLHCRVIWFSETPPRLEGHGGEGVWCENGMVTMQLDGRRETLWPVEALRLPGRHMLHNALAATALARAIGLEPEAVDGAIRSFRGQEHCLERVAERAGVLYVNDSKGTNVDAVTRALESYGRPIVWIAGGLDKGGRFELLRPAVGQRVKRAIFFGSARRALAEALAGAVTVDEVETLEEAVARAAAAAVAGDVVLFSPACASFDQFRDYRERGERFRALVGALG